MMLLKIITAVFLVVPAQNPKRQDGWHGIVPLRATRSDVERLIGIEGNSGRTSVYRTENETVRFEYIISPCRGSLPGWNVPANTVLQIEVISSEKKLFSDLYLDESKYIKTAGRSGWTAYINLEEGIKYEVLPDGIVYSVTYIPSVKDSHLRCPGYPPYDGSSANYQPYDTYGDVPFATEVARLDNFAFSLQGDPAMKGYIIVYAGQSTPVSKARARAERARNYLINKRDIDRERIIVLDGGYRLKTETELYIVPSNMAAPSPTPTVIQSEVKSDKEDKAKDNRHAASFHRKPR